MATMTLPAAGMRAEADRLRRYADCEAATTRAGDGWLAVATGVLSNDMNGVVSEPGARLSAAVVDEVVRWFAERGAPASWLVTGDDAALTALLLDRGARSEATGWWCGRAMGDDLLQLPAVDGVTVSRVTTAADLDDWLDVASRCGWIDDDADGEARRRLYLSVGLDDDALAHWVARGDSRPVGLASSFVTGEVLDLCNLAVVEAERRSGIGRALAGERIRVADERGVRTIVAALSPDGWELYRTLGFASVPVVPDRWFYLPSS